uniref:Uncharacterized protein n=1 Tax=Tanacetum cinerariifolium TaxID=118510 RepID=A0A699ICB8_TANCI|nr:hypothetical protein CTI12_AA182560 [Tanacetum cinerariifolium]
MERVIGNALDAVIQIISLAIIQNHLAIKIKRPLLEVLKAIAKMTPRTKLTMKLVSWLNREKKRSHSDKGMRRMERVIGNALDAVIQIISLAIIQNHLATKIKRPLLEVLKAIAKMTPRTKLTMKLVSWLNRESLNVTFDESPPLTKLSPLVHDDVGEEEAIENNTKVVNNSNKEDESIEVDEVVYIKESKNHPLE